MLAAYDVSYYSRIKTKATAIQRLLWLHSYDLSQDAYGRIEGLPFKALDLFKEKLENSSLTLELDQIFLVGRLVQEQRNARGRSLQIILSSLSMNCLFWRSKDLHIRRQ